MLSLIKSRYYFYIRVCTLLAKVDRFQLYTIDATTKKCHTCNTSTMNVKSVHRQNLHTYYRKSLTSADDLYDGNLSVVTVFQFLNLKFMQNKSC